jgi:hypothetical protein
MQSLMQSTSAHPVTLEHMSLMYCSLSLHCVLHYHRTLCRAVFARYQKEPDPSINFFMIVLMIALGAGVVMGIPYMMRRCVPLSLLSCEWHVVSATELFVLT